MCHVRRKRPSFDFASLSRYEQVRSAAPFSDMKITTLNPFALYNHNIFLVSITRDCQNVAACAVDGADVNVSFSDIGGLDSVVAKLRQVEPQTPYKNCNQYRTSHTESLQHVQLVVLPFAQAQSAAASTAHVSSLLRPPTGNITSTVLWCCSLLLLHWPF